MGKRTTIINSVDKSFMTNHGSPAQEQSVLIPDTGLSLEIKQKSTLYMPNNIVENE